MGVYSAPLMRTAFFPVSFSQRAMMTSQKCGSSSMRRARRSSCSQQTMVVPEPPKVSSTVSPCRLLLITSCPNRRTGFIVGWSSSTIGFAQLMTVVGTCASVLLSSIHVNPRPRRPPVRHPDRQSGCRRGSATRSRGQRLVLPFFRSVVFIG